MNTDDHFPSAGTVAKCAHCGVDVVVRNYAWPGLEWRHRPPGNLSERDYYRHCKLTVAEPADDTPDPVAVSHRANHPLYVATARQLVAILGADVEWRTGDYGYYVSAPSTGRSCTVGGPPMRTPEPGAIEHTASFIADRLAQLLTGTEA